MRIDTSDKENTFWGKKDIWVKSNFAVERYKLYFAQR